MALVATQPCVKVIGANGQISLGKQYAGRQVLVEEHEPGVWLVRTATIIPDSEIWLHQPKAAADLQNALSWAQANTPADNNLISRWKSLVAKIDEGGLVRLDLNNPVFQENLLTL